MAATRNTEDPEPPEIAGLYIQFRLSCFCLFGFNRFDQPNIFDRSHVPDAPAGAIPCVVPIQFHPALPNVGRDNQAVILGGDLLPSDAAVFIFRIYILDNCIGGL